MSWSGAPTASDIQHAPHCDDPPSMRASRASSIRLRRPSDRSGTGADRFRGLARRGAGATRTDPHDVGDARCARSRALFRDDWLFP